MAVKTLSQSDLMYLELLKVCLTGSAYDESAWLLLRQNSQPAGGVMAKAAVFFRNYIARSLDRFSLAIVKTNAFNLAARKNGSDWPLIGYTMIGERRLQNIADCVKNILERDVKGDFIETGVWRGGATIFMRALLKLYGAMERRVWVADSFEGMPKPKKSSDGMDLSHRSYFSVSLDQVKNNFDRFGLLDEQVTFLKGWFCDTLPSAPIENIALLRLDGDLYGSTMDSLTNLYHKVSAGGFIIVDDYLSWASCKRAVDDFLEGIRAKVDIIKIDGDGVYWQKPY